MTDKQPVGKKSELPQGPLPLEWDEDNQCFWLGSSTMSKRCVAKLFNLLNAKPDPVEGLQELAVLFHHGWSVEVNQAETAGEEKVIDKKYSGYRKTLTDLGVNLD